MILGLSLEISDVLLRTRVVMTMLAVFNLGLSTENMVQLIMVQTVGSGNGARYQAC